MSGDVQVRFCERLGVRVPRATHLVLGFQHRSDAERLWKELNERLRKFRLELHPEKTRLLEFGPFAADNRARRGQGKPETFDFLASRIFAERREVTDGLRCLGRRCASGCRPS